MPNVNKNILLQHITTQLEAHLLWLQQQDFSFLPQGWKAEDPPAAVVTVSEELLPSTIPMDFFSLIEPKLSSKTEMPPSLQDTSPDLPSLYKKHCECQLCPLGATRQNWVFGSGNPQASLMFVGEGPGADEDVQGLPFVGKAGRLLGRMIQSMGIQRDDVYLANAVKCRPPENRTPLPAEMHQCLPILKRQIELVNPKLLITLGNIATQILIPSAPGVTKARGQLFQYEQWTVLPTFHPAYLLRNPPAMEQAWKDFKQIKQLAF